MKAGRYAFDRQAALRFLLKGCRIYHDTNPAERQLKPDILLRKGVFCINSEQGGKAWVAMTSCVETGELNQLDPFWYFVSMIDGFADVKSNQSDSVVERSCRLHGFAATYEIGWGPSVRKA